MNASTAGSDERPTVWSRSVTAPWFLVLGAVCTVGVVVAALLVGEERAAILWLLLAALAPVALGSVRVRVDAGGVTVTSVVLPFLRRRIRTSAIGLASAAPATPLQLGGWGYRWKPGMGAVSLRAGDALWLDLLSGRRFVVTVDDAGTAARLVNSYLLDPDGEQADEDGEEPGPGA